MQMDGPVNWPGEVVALRLDLSGGASGAAPAAGGAQ
jgi:general secretion pathway protein J